MKRRGFIKLMVAGGSVFLFPNLINGYNSNEAGSNAAGAELKADDVRLRLITKAMRAPNSHNIQPWMFNLTGKMSFDLFVDQDRLLPHTDPPSRQIHISQGTFLEYLKIAAASEGWHANIKYFPQGEYTNQVIEHKPVAFIQLVNGEQEPERELTSWLSRRQSNKRLYDDQRIPSTLLAELENMPVESGIEVFYSDSKRLKEKLAPLLGRAMEIETQDPDRHAENVNHFRFSEKEALEKQDGFTLGNNGVTGFKRFIAETFFLGTKKEANATDSSFAREGIKLAYKQAESAVAYGWIVSDTNTRMDQIKVGELYSRINLITTKLGVAQHPMSQILEEYEDMRELQEEFLSLLNIPRGKTVQMLYRLGYAEPVPPTLRRDVTKLV